MMAVPNNPAWTSRTVPTSSPSPFGNEFEGIETSDTSRSYYHLLISGVVPRPIAFVSSQSKGGVVNLAPFSYFGAIAHDPPTISIGVCNKRGGVKKDTLRNMEETGEFVVNIISEWMVDSANHCSGEFPFEEDEFILSGLTKLPSDLVAPPRVMESAFHMECKVTALHEIRNKSGEHTATNVIGEVLKFHVAKPLLVTSPRLKVDFDRGFRPMGRLGGDTWVKQGDTFDLLRPNVG